jgi:hypothetical protein
MTGNRFSRYAAKALGTNAPKPGEDYNFSDLKVSFAVDVSTSTRGWCLEQESKVVLQIQSILSIARRKEARLLPWSGKSGPVMSLQDISNLKPSFGTDPTVLYKSPHQLQALRDSSLWFLLTDGQIASSTVQDFATQTLNLGLHGTPCVVIIFGSTYWPPAQADISVGMSVFALAADCLYLFHDLKTKSGLAYILQAKGCFKQFLPGGTQLNLHSSTTWGDLPRISYHDLGKVRTPPPQKLGNDEIALGNNRHVRFDDIYSGNLDDSTLDGILRDPTSMNSIAQAEVARGRSGELQNWISEQTVKDSKNSARFTDAQLESRSKSLASASNWVGIVESEGASAGAFLSPMRMPDPPETESGPGYTDYHAQKPIVPYYQPTMIPEKKPDDALNFKGPCMRCQKYATLALLFKQPPSEFSTPEFPAEYSMTPQAFPLAMGVFTETDIISLLVYCSECSAATLQKKFSSENNPKITGRLLLQPFSETRATWLAELSSAFEHRFSGDDLPQIFLAVCDSTLQNLPLASWPTSNFEYSASAGQKSATQQLSSAIMWVRSELLYYGDMPNSLKALTGPMASSMSFPGTLPEVSKHFTMDCPLEAFAVFVRLEIDFHFVRWNSQAISVIVFKRLLLHLTQAYLGMLEDDGVLQTSMFMTPLLFNTGDDWRMTTSFKDLEPRINIGINALSNTPLLDEEAVQIFSSLGDAWDVVESKMNAALAVYLHYLVKFGSQQPSAEAAYGMLIEQEPMKVNPRMVTMAQSGAWISELWRRK